MRLVAILLSMAALPACAELRGWTDTHPPAAAVLLDARPLSACTQRSIAGTRCLPAADFFDAQGRLAPWREILWLFSTARLTGAESVAVIGETDAERLRLAALLELAGQRRVWVVAQPVAQLLATGWPEGTGRARDFARQHAYTAAMRETLIVLPHEPRPAQLVSGREPAQTLERWAQARLKGETPRILLGGNP